MTVNKPALTADAQRALASSSIKCSAATQLAHTYVRVGRSSVVNKQPMVVKMRRQQFIVVNCTPCLRLSVVTVPVAIKTVYLRFTVLVGTSGD